MHDAYDDLPEATKRKIDGLKAVHVYQSKYSPRSLGTINEESRRNLPPPGIHPLVRTHPENGRKAAIMLRFSWSIHVNTEPAGASFGAYRSNHIFRPEAPRRAAAGSETGLLFDFDDVPPNCFHVLADGAVVGRIMRVIQYRRRQVGVRSAGVCFLDPFRLEYCEHLRRAKMEDPEAVANAGLPIPQGKF